MKAKRFFITLKSIVVDNITYALNPPVSKDELANYTSIFKNNLDKLDENILREIGTKLFQRFFTSSVLDKYYSTGNAVALVLSKELEELPWELMHDGTDWVARNRGLIRVGTTYRNAPEIIPKLQPLKVLSIISDGMYDDTIIDSEQEQIYTEYTDNYLEMFKSLAGEACPIEIKIQDHITREKFSYEMNQNMHVIHFIGKVSSGMLVFETRHSAFDSIENTWLKENITTALRGNLRLIIINSCHSEHNQINSLVSSLLDTGIPAVIVLQPYLSKLGNLTFIKSFYKDLSAGKTIEKALKNALHAMASDWQIKPYEWAMPILFVNDSLLEEETSSNLIDEEMLEMMINPSVQVYLPKKAELDIMLTREQICIDKGAELNDLLRSLDPERLDGVKTVCLYGESGIGKTNIMISAVKRMAEWFDKIIYFDAKFNDLMLLAYRCGAQPQGDETTEQLCQKIVNQLSNSGKKLLIIESADSLAEPDDLKKLLTSMPDNCKVILTSQRIIDENLKTIKINFMSKQESIELIKEIGMKDENGYDEIIHFTGGHPLCLSLIAGQAIVSGKDLSSIQKDIKKAKDSVIEHVINSSIKQALKDGRRILSVLSIFDRTLSRKALQEICQLDEDSFNKALDRLLKLFLIESYQSGKRFYLHSKIRQRAKTLLAKDPNVSLYYERAGNFFRDFSKATVPMTVLTTATQALELQMPAGTSREQLQSAAMELIVNPAKQMLEIELDNCRNVLGWAINNKIDLALDMLNILGDVLCSHGYLNEVADYYSKIIEKLDDKQKQMMAYYSLSALYHNNGKFDSAIYNYESALDLAQELHEKEIEAEILNNLGLISKQMQKIEKSIEYFERLNDLLKDLGKHRESAEIIFTLGTLNQVLGKDEIAIQCFESAYNIFRENNDRQGIASVLIHKAEYYKKNSQLDSAIACYQEALDRYNDLSESEGQAFVSMILGEMYQKQGDMEKAIAYYQNSLKFANNEVRQKIMDNMAKIYCMQKQWAKSAEACSESFQISIQLQPVTILNSIRNMLEIVKFMFEAREFAIPAQLAYNLSQVIQNSEIYDEEMRAALAISHGVFTVIGFVAVSENESTNTMYKEAMELARNLDESTGNILNLLSYLERR